MCILVRLSLYYFRYCGFIGFSSGQVYSNKTLRQLYPTPTNWGGADDTFIEQRIKDLPIWIKGISSQALDDFKCLLLDFRESGVVLGLTGDIVSAFYSKKK